MMINALHRNLFHVTILYGNDIEGWWKGISTGRSNPSESLVFRDKEMDADYGLQDIGRYQVSVYFTDSLFFDII